MAISSETHIRNSDELDEFFEENGFDSEDVYFNIVKEEGMYYAEIREHNNDNRIAYTDTFDTKKEIKKFITYSFGNTYDIREEDPTQFLF